MRHLVWHGQEGIIEKVAANKALKKLLDRDSRVRKGSEMGVSLAKYIPKVVVFQRVNITTLKKLCQSICEENTDSREKVKRKKRSILKVRDLQGSSHLFFS